ncbi:MAG TPA: DUF5131 family protein [Stellaceae bacterium]|nr:DUF5131 family protein [Stellaceae bacterium]
MARRAVEEPDALFFALGSRRGESRRGEAPPWYDVTWNPTAGCSAMGPGCDHCQALRTVAQLARIGGKGGSRYAGLTLIDREGLRWSGEIRMRTELITWPLLQRRSRRILLDSMSDPFHEKLSTATIDILHAVMQLAHWHQFLVLTRRAERMRRYYSDPLTPRRIAAAIAELPALAVAAATGERRSGAAATDDRRSGAAATDDRRSGARRDAATVRSGEPADAAVALGRWPLANLWPGVSVEDQERIGRIGELLQMPAARRWACFQPLLGPVRPDAVPIGNRHAHALTGGRGRLDPGCTVPSAESAVPSLDWVLAGGEVGVGVRVTRAEWLRRLRDNCVEAGVPFFFQGWGEWAPEPDGFGDRMVRLGRRAGRLIDGRSWDELPAALRRPATPRR